MNRNKPATVPPRGSFDTLPEWDNAMESLMEEAWADMEEPLKPPYEPKPGCCPICGLAITSHQKICGETLASGRPAHRACLAAELSKDHDGGRHRFYSLRGLELPPDELREALYPMALAKAMAHKQERAAANGRGVVFTKVLEFDPSLV